jgi:GTP-binding protein Era
VPVIDATASIGPGDRLVLQRAAVSSRAATATPAGPGDLSRLLLVVNKVDKASPGQVLRQLAEAQRVLEDTGRGDEAQDGDAVPTPEPAPDSGAQYFPLSAASGKGVDALLTAVLELLPEGPPYFPEEMTSDVSEGFWVGELVREQLLATVREELPHSIACRVTEWEWPRIRVEILVERESQKGIVIGQGGLVLKAVGTAVREQLPPGAFVELFVRVEKRWQQRPETIERLGY